MKVIYFFFKEKKNFVFKILGKFCINFLFGGMKWLILYFVFN